MTCHIFVLVLDGSNVKTDNLNCLVETLLVTDDMYRVPAVMIVMVIVTDFYKYIRLGSVAAIF